MRWIVLAIALFIVSPAHAANMACLPGSIRTALAKAHNACGIHVISTLRRGARIAGSGRVSMHASCRAADFTTPRPGCVLSTLRSWSGKLSTDYARVKHFHIDNGSYARFAHGGHRRHAKRWTRGHHYVRRHHHRRYAWHK